MTQRGKFWNKESRVIGNNKGGIAYARLGDEGSSGQKNAAKITAALRKGASFDYHSHTSTGSEGFSTRAQALANNVDVERTDETARWGKANLGFHGADGLGDENGNIFIWRDVNPVKIFSMPRLFNSFNPASLFPIFR